MSENTKIEWATHTFNPWEGCQKVGPGCDNCYAENRNARFAGGTAINWGPGAPRRRTSEANWRKPLAWNANHEAFFKEHGHRQRVFCSSLADVFDNAVDPQWLGDLFELIQRTPNLDWLLLTKRIGNWKSRMQAVLDSFGSRMPPTPRPRSVSDEEADSMNWVDAWLRNDVDPIPANVWIGATICNQEEADRDIPKLLAVPAAKRFLSMEPLLGPVKLPRFCDCGCRLPWQRAVSDAMKGASALNRDQAESSVKSTLGIDWVIVGGESGPNDRSMLPHWATSLRDQCVAASVSFLLKQWGEWAPEGDNAMRRIGKKAAGRLLDGRTWDEVPS